MIRRRWVKDNGQLIDRLIDWLIDLSSMDRLIYLLDENGWKDIDCDGDAILGGGGGGGGVLGD